MKSHRPCRLQFTGNEDVTMEFDMLFTVQARKLGLELESCQEKSLFLT
jgi:hypothetical protein